MFSSFRRPEEPLVHDGRPSLGPQVNHIIAARNEFANAFGDLARGKRNWQLIAFALTGLLSLVTLAYVRLSPSSRVVPYVIEVDRLGQIAAVGTAGEMKSPEQRLVASQLAQFIRSIRTVLPVTASAAQAELVRRGYAFVAPEAVGLEIPGERGLFLEIGCAWEALADFLGRGPRLSCPVR